MTGSPLRPLTVILAVDHGGKYVDVQIPAWTDASGGNHPAHTGRHWEPEPHDPEGSPIVITEYTETGEPRVCRFCSCLPTQHAVAHPRVTIGINPSLVTSVQAMRAPGGVVYVRTTYQRRATNTVRGMEIRFGEEYYLVEGTVESVLAQLAYDEGANNLEILRRQIPAGTPSVS